MQQFVWTGIFLAGWLLIAGCESEKKDDDGEEKSNSEMVQQFDESRKALKKDLDKAVEEADDQIARLEEQMEDASGDIRLQLEITLEKMKAERQKVINKAKGVAGASRESWKDFESEAQDLAQRAKANIDTLAMNFKKLSN